MNGSEYIMPAREGQTTMHIRMLVIALWTKLRKDDRE